MSSVTQFLKQQLQWDSSLWDYRKYLNRVIYETDGLFLDRENEVFSPSFMGTFIDYLVRFKISENFLESFDVPIKGLVRFRETHTFFESNIRLLSDALKVIKEFRNRKNFELNLEDLGKLSKLIPYEIYFRSGINPKFPNNLNEPTIKNIQILVNRTIGFLKSLDGEIFFGGGISMTTKNISCGDWDYMVGENLIDLKITTKSCSRLRNWLQILIYYLLGKKSEDPKFKKIKNLVLFNPSLNDAYFLEVKVIPRKIVYCLWHKMNN